MRGVSFRRLSRVGELFKCSHKAHSKPRKGDTLFESPETYRLWTDADIEPFVRVPVQGSGRHGRVSTPSSSLDPKAGES